MIPIKWQKKGLIFNTDNNFDWMVSHAAVPIVDKSNDDTLRIYFGPRDKENRTYISFIDVEIGNPKKIKYIHDKPILTLGKLGCFDDSGTMPSCIINYEDKKYLYYIGWNTAKTVPYRNSVGLAISTDNGKTFRRIFDGPILDRSHYDPYFLGSSFIMIENNIWKMWYLSTTSWVKIEDKIEPIYNIKYAESKDGINWVKENLTCIKYKNENEAISRPCVIKEDNLYKMWYSYRGSIDYRTRKEQSYRIGYAESKDGKEWVRKDELVGIDCSENGWDSLMIEYPYIYKHNNSKYLFYCGNGFGKSGFGYAVLEEE